MNKYFAFLAVALATLLFVGVAFAEDEVNETEEDKDAPYLRLTGVRNLTRSTLDDVRQGDWLLVIVAQWCGFSRNIVSKLSAVAFNLKQAQVAVIDGEEDPSIHIQFSTESYPYICYVHDGAIHVFNGIPEWDIVLKWASGEWKNVKPLDGPSNPFGWQMTIIGATTHFFWSIYDFVGKTAARIGISTSAAFSIIFGSFTVAVLVVVLFVVARYDDDIVMPVAATKPKVQKPKEDEKKPKEKTEEKAAEKPQEKPQEKQKDSAIRKRKKTAKKLDD